MLAGSDPTTRAVLSLPNGRYGRRGAIGVEGTRQSPARATITRHHGHPPDASHRLLTALRGRARVAAAPPGWGSGATQSVTRWQ